MRSTLQISRDLALPAEAVTATFRILVVRGASAFLSGPELAERLLLGSSQTSFAQ